MNLTIENYNTKHSYAQVFKLTPLPRDALLVSSSPDTPRSGGWIEIKWVKCGKNCRGCPHGPYLYARWREGKRLRSKYLGKAAPPVDESTATNLEALGLQVTWKVEV